MIMLVKNTIPVHFADIIFNSFLPEHTGRHISLPVVWIKKSFLIFYTYDMNEVCC